MKIAKTAAFASPLLFGWLLSAQAQPTPGSAEAADDWQQRAAGAGVFYTNNFSSYANASDLRDAASKLTHIAGEKEVNLDNARYISGGQALQIKTYSSVAKNGGSWGDSYNGGARVNDFYFQVALYLPRETIGWRSKGSDGQLKLINMERYGGGQVVIHHNKGLGFPTLMTNGSGVLQRRLDSTAYAQSSGDYFYQNAIDSGSSLGSSEDSYWRRFGPSRRTRSEFDYSYIDTDQNANFVYNRGFDWPNPDAIGSGAVPWNLDGWTVVEVYISTKENRAPELKMWAAPYGSAPTLVVDINAPDSDQSQAPRWVDSLYREFELLNYETPRQSETGYRPTLYTYFDEVIASSSPIPFPGGFGLSDAASGGTTQSSGSGGTSDTGTSSTSTNPLATKSAPAWVTQLTPGTWSAISRNTLADVDPADDPDANPNYPNSGGAPWRGSSGQESVIKSWNGGALATNYGARGSLILFGGGHANYYGSEVYAFDLEARTWSRLSDPYSGPFNWPYPTGEYPDGSAIPPHTYDFVDYHPGTNSFVLLKGNSQLGSNPERVDIAHMFDLGTKSWRRSPLNRDDPRLSGGGYSAYDSRRDLFWTEGGSTGDLFVQFDPKPQNSDGTFGGWTSFPSQITKTDSQAVYDPANDVLLVTAFRNDDRVAAIDLKNPSEKRVWLSETGSPPNKRPAHGWSWSKRRGAPLYFGRSGAEVYELKLTSGDWKTGTWAWRKLLATTNQVIPPTSENDNGVYSRFQVVSYADAEVAIVVNSTKGPVYAFLVPDAVRPRPPSPLTAE